MCVFNFSSPFYLLYLLLNSCDGNGAFYAHETVQLLQQEILDFISPDLCLPNSLVDPETQSTTEFGDWCRNVCAYFCVSLKCNHDTSDLMQHISDTWASLSQNVEADGQCRKRLCASKRTSLWTSAKL